MRRALTLVLTVVTLNVGRLAWAEDVPPPPPPPPPSETDSSTSSGDSGGSALKARDALLDRSTGKKRPLMLSFFMAAVYPYWNVYTFAFGPTVRFNIPLVHDGFVPQINDSLDLEFGLDFAIAPNASAYGYAPVYFLPVVEPRYTVYLLNNLAVYAKPLNLGIMIWPIEASYRSPVSFHWSGAVGVLYKVTDKLHLRGEIGTYAVRLGLGIAF